MAFIPPIGSTVAFQSDPTKLVGTVSVVGNMNSSVTAFQGTSPWIVNQPSPSVIAYQAAGSILAVSGSFSSGNTSVTAFQGGAWSASISGGIIGSVISIPGFVSTANSTTATLGGGAVFTGTSEDVKDFATIVISIFADQASAADGLSIQQSSNGTNWDITDTYTVAASTGKTFSVQPAARFFRIVYTNGASIQGVFRLQTVYHTIATKASSQRPTDAYTNETDLEQVWGFNSYWNGATWDRIKGTTALGMFVNSTGSVLTVGGGTQITSVVNTIPSSMLVGASIMGTVPVTQTTSPWVINMPSPSVISYQLAGSIMAVAATVNTGNSSVQLLGGNAVIGSVTTLQGTNPWQVNVPTPSYISYQLAGSVMAVSATVNTGNSSVQLLGGVATIGSVVALQGTDPWKINMPSPSMIAYQLAGSIMAVSATVNTGNSSVQLLGGVAVIGSVAVLQGTSPWLIGNSSVQTIQGTTPWVVGSVITTVQGSVATAVTNFTASVAANINVISASIATNLQSTNASVLTVVQGSVSAVINNSSVWALQGTSPWVIQSIVGTYAEDSGHISGDKGLLAFGVRNDTVASLVNADLDYGAWAQDSSGRHLIKPFVSEDGTIISYVGSVVSTSVTLIAPSITGKRAYITDFWIANTGSVATLLQFRDGSTSVVGNTIAPAGGGSNAPGIAIPLKTAPSQDLVFTGLTATSVLYVTVKGYQAP